MGLRIAGAPVGAMRRVVSRTLAWCTVAWCTIALPGVPAIVSAQEVLREASNEERVAWMEQLRAYPYASYLRNPVYAARAAGLASAPSPSSGMLAITAWREVGPFGFQTSGFYGSSPNADGGRVKVIAVHPTNPSIIFAGSASGGVWRSTNGGATWSPRTDLQCSLNTGAIAIDPVDPTIVYVGTGEPPASNGCGLLRSFDGGDSWTEINGDGVLAPTSGAQTTRAYRIRIDRSTAGSRSTTTLLYAANNGLHRSVNSGTTWSTVLPGAITDLRNDPVLDNVFWAARIASGVDNGLWRSTDHGATWTKVWSAPSATNRLAIAVSPVPDGPLWIAVVGTTSRLDALLRYDRTTGTAIPVAAAGVYDPSTRLNFAAQSTWNLVLEADPTDAEVVYAGGSRMYRSRDGGATFSLIAYDLHVDWHAFEFAPSDPNVIVVGNDGGVYASYDRANSWVSRNTNLSVTQFYPGLAVHPTIPDVLAGGLQDNSSLWGFGAGFWTMSAPTGDGGYNAWSPADPNVFWATSYSFGYVIRVTRAALTGGTGAQYRGFSGTDRKQFLPPLVIDPTDERTLYYGTYRLWRTTNEGLTWTPFTGDLSQGSGTITAVAVSPADSRVIWVGTNDGVVQRSVDRGVSFSVVSGALPNRAVTDIAVDDTDVDRAVVTFSGSGTGHVYVTADQGATWTNRSAGLPDIPFNAVVLVPGTTRILTGADVGVYESVDNGVTWNIAGPGMPNVRVLDLVYQRATGLIYAGTFGRGIWAAQLLSGSAVLRGDVNRDGMVNAFDAVLVQQALVGVTPSVNQSPLPAGDANCNGRLDSGDVLAVLQFAVGSAPVSLCVGTVR